MNVQPINLGDEGREGIQFRLTLAPIIVCRPISRELLHRRELHALRCIGDSFPLRPPGCFYAPAQFGKFRFGNIDMEGTDCGGLFPGGGSSPAANGEISPSGDAWTELTLMSGF